VWVRKPGRLVPAVRHQPQRPGAGRAELPLPLRVASWRRSSYCPGSPGCSSTARSGSSA